MSLGTNKSNILFDYTMKCSLCIFIEAQVNSISHPMRNSFYLRPKAGKIRNSKIGGIFVTSIDVIIPK